MMLSRASLALLLTSIAASSCVQDGDEAASLGQGSLDRELCIEHVTIVSPERSAPLSDASVLIRDGRIVSITRCPASRSAELREVVDGRGLYLSPGLIDSHVHINDMPGLPPPLDSLQPEVAQALRDQEPRSYLYFGFTTLVDAIGSPERTWAWAQHDTHPDLYFCGATPISAGYPQTYQSAEDQIRQYPYLIVEGGEPPPAGIDPAEHTPEAVVARMKADEALCVKTFHERGFGEVDVMPAPRLDTIRALVAAAHAAGMPVLMHANGTNAQEFAVEAGVDIIAHGLWHWNGEPEATALTARTTAVLDGVLDAGAGWQPTMRVLYGQRDVFDPSLLADARMARVTPPTALDWYRSPQGQWYHDAAAPVLLPQAIVGLDDPSAEWDAIRSLADAPLLVSPIERNAASLRYMAEHGANLLFGSDTPGSASYANQPGLNGFREMELLVEAGMTPAQVFRAATLDNAEALGLGGEIGTVEPGRRANLLLTRSDPSETINAYDDIAIVIVGGRAIDREDLAADRP